MDVLTVLAEVSRIAPGLHKAGTFSTPTLEALVRHASARPVHHSAETGSGASTLLFSHLSEHHTVFAMDGGTGSIRSIETSPLLRQDRVTFVEGPTQLTLPSHVFTHPLQLVLIDGPHGYPFPDLEYYYLYQHLEPGGLLIVDDIHIPTIGNLYDFLRADEMFELQQVVETTAFFRRTNAAMFPPTGDGWWTQRYNQRAFEGAVADRVTGDLPEQTDRPTSFHVDQLGPVGSPMAVASLEVPRGEALTVTGWAVDVTRRTPAAAVHLVLDGVSYTTDLRVPRADVVAALGEQAYLRCGFNANLPGVAIGPGAHDLEVRIVVNGGRAYYAGARLHFRAR